MSSTAFTTQSDSPYKTYLINPSEGTETENPEEKPAVQTSPRSFKAYSPDRASFHTVRGKIKRYFA